MRDFFVVLCLLEPSALYLSPFANQSDPLLLLYPSPTMAAVQEIAPRQTKASRHYAAHPMCPLTGPEISSAGKIIKSFWPSNVDLRFKVITLEEPPKKQFVPYLEAEHAGNALPRIDRKAFVAYYIRNTVCGTLQQSRS
jgi:Cu2+-containing amine oxidase